MVLYFHFQQIMKKTYTKKTMKISTPLTKVLGNIKSKKYIYFLTTNNALLNIQQGLDPPLSQLH